MNVFYLNDGNFLPQSAQSENHKGRKVLFLATFVKSLCTFWKKSKSLNDLVPVIRPQYA
jgi:hypothetical protein